MNRETYIQYRMQNLLTPVAYDFYVRNSKVHLDYESFKTFFMIFVTRGSTYIVEMPVIFEDIEGRETKGTIPYQATIDWNLIWKHYDQKFNLTLVENLKTKKIIKIL